eukprot:757789-Hanusia_phi.AAC.2
MLQAAPSDYGSEHGQEINDEGQGDLQARSLAACGRCCADIAEQPLKPKKNSLEDEYRQSSGSASYSLLTRVGDGQGGDHEAAQEDAGHGALRRGFGWCLLSGRGGVRQEHTHPHKTVTENSCTSWDCLSS